MSGPGMAMGKIKTFEDAFRFVGKVKICTIFASDKTEHTSLWENVDLPEKKPGEKGWGEKVVAVWSWKNRLPAEFPDEIFYGKIKGGFAVLMDMDYLRNEHFPKAYKPVKELNPLAGYIFEQIRIEPRDTTTLRNRVMAEQGCSKSQFDTALKQLQISMNIVRSNHPDIEQDTWLTFKEGYGDIWEEHVGGAS